MSRRNLVLLVAGLIAVVAAVGVVVVAPPDAEAAQTQAQLDLVLEFPANDDGGTLGQRTDSVVSKIGSRGPDGVSFVVDSFFDVYYVRNIGSSGQDGVRFGFDSFFDITYELKFRTIETEMVALSLSGSYSVGLNEAQVLDKARSAAIESGGRVYYGHVTVLK